MTDPRPLAERCSAIEMLLLDVDGVLTDGSIVYSSDGGELKAFHVLDGSSLKLWHRIGKQSALLTGRSSEMVNVRAKELGISQVIQGASEKWPAYRRLLAETGMRPEQVCFVADDLPDLPILGNCGLAVAV